MEVVMQMMYSYSLELLAAAVGLMLLLELVTLRKINKWKKKEKAEKQNHHCCDRDFCFTDSCSSAVCHSKTFKD